MVRSFGLASLLVLLLATRVEAQLTWSLAGGNENWPSWARDTITKSMNEAVGLFNQHGYFQKHLTANYNTGVPTAQANYDGWIDFGSQYNTRTALHEIAHALGTGTYWPFNGGTWGVDSAAGRMEKVFDGQGAVLNTGGSHFWPYGLNYDNEDNPAARERHCKLVAAFRFDMGIVVDSDTDGMPDDWEQHSFGGLAKTATGDVDGDGISNLDEYATDSNPNRASPVLDGHVYTLRSQLTQRAVTVQGASMADGAAIEQRTLDGQPWQQWKAQYAGKGYFRFTNVKSGKVLEVPGTDTASGRPLRQAAWTGSLQQQWRIAGGVGAKADHWQIANRETARLVDGLDGAEGAPIQQYPYLGNIPQQFWTFTEVPQQGEMVADAGSDAGSQENEIEADEEAQEPDARDAGSVADAAEADSGGAEEDSDLGFNNPPTRGGCSLVSGRSGPSTIKLLVALLATLLVLRGGRRRAGSLVNVAR